MIVSFLSRLTCFFIDPKNWMLAAYLTPNLFLPLCLGSILAYAKRYNPKFSKLFNNIGLMYGSILIYSFTYYLTQIMH